MDLRRTALAAVATLAVALIPISAMAQQQELAPEHLALARQYVDLTDRSNLYEIALVQVGVETMRTVLTQHPDLSEPLDTAIKKTLEAYKVRKGDLMDQFARLYALRSTPAELQQIVDFYQSEVGQKLTVANATMSVDLLTVLQLWEANLKTEFFSAVKAELKAAGHTI